MAQYSVEKCNQEIRFWTAEFNKAKERLQWWMDEQKDAFKEEREKVESKTNR